MTPEQIVSTVGIVVGIFLWLWGAGLSTYLAIREKRKEKRKISVFLEYTYYTETLQISIVNTGFRPVTVVNSTVVMGSETVPHGGFAENPLPVVLGDGQRVTIPFDRYVSRMWWENRDKFPFKIMIIDAEGNKYEPIGDVRYFNAKYGSYEGQGL